MARVDGTGGGTGRPADSTFRDIPPFGRSSASGRGLRLRHSQCSRLAFLVVGPPATRSSPFWLGTTKGVPEMWHPLRVDGTGGGTRTPGRRIWNSARRVHPGSQGSIGVHTYSVSGGFTFAEVRLSSCALVSALASILRTVGFHVELVDATGLHHRRFW